MTIMRKQRKERKERDQLYIEIDTMYCKHKIPEKIN